MYETLDVLKHLPEKICSEEFLIPEVLKLDVSEEDMEREHRWVADCGHTAVLESLPLKLFRKQLKRRQSLQQQQQGGRDTSR